jgi:hypothetical protein
MLRDCMGTDACVSSWSPAGFEAETEDELTVMPGDEVTVQVAVEGWVQITRNNDGQKGLVPASYLEHL